MRRQTTREVAAAIENNVARLYSIDGKVPDAEWVRFRAEQRRLWDYAASRSERFVEGVCARLGRPFTQETVERLLARSKAS